MRTSLLILIIAFPRFLFSQCWTYYNTSNSGLPSNNVNDITINPITNDIWVATQGAGLAKFDGSNWTVYNSSNSLLPDNFIKAIAFDSFGILWIGMEFISVSGFNGVVEYDGLNWSLHDVPTIWPNVSITPYTGAINDIAIDNLNNVWVAASGGATKFNRVNWFGYTSATGLVANNFNSVTVDTQNNIWFGSLFYYGGLNIPGEGIAKFDGTNWIIYDSTNSGLADNEIQDIAFDRQQNAWIGTGNSLSNQVPISIFDSHYWNYFDSVTTGFFGVGDIQLDGFGNVWIAPLVSTFSYNKIYLYNGIDWTALSVNFPGGPSFTKIAVDTSENIWIGTGGGGLAKYSCNTPPPQPDYTLSGVVFIDDNQNGIKDGLEAGLQREIVKLVRTPPKYTITDLSSKYNFVVDTGNYSVSYLPGEYWSATSQTTQTGTINNGNYTTTGIDFGIHPRIDKQDIAVYLTGGRTTCGRVVNYQIDYRNLATKVVSGTVTFTFYNSFLTYLSSFPVADNVSSNQVVWNYSNLQPFEYRQLLVKLQVIGEVEGIGIPILTSVEIQPLNGDLRPENNYDNLVQIATCAYDPNDKLVKPEGVGEDKLTLFGQELVYTIRFQNTGNDTAFNITIDDTLDQNLEVQTFRFIGSSHAADFDIKGSGIVVFTLKNIMLPDSNVDYTGSQGFVKYSIRPKDSLPETTIVSNRAAIVFDSNNPVFTNRVFNTLVSSIPTAVEVISKDKTTIQIFPNPSENSIEVVYNPNSGNIKTIEIYTLQGKMIMSFSNPKTLNISDLLEGLYFLSIKDETGRILKVEKVIKQY